MFRSIDDFLPAWKYESEATRKLFLLLTDESLSHRVTPEGRSLGKLAWHITASIGDMLGRLGFKPEGPTDDLNPPSTVREIVDAYDRTSKSAVAQIRDRWNDASLLEVQNVFGEEWSNGTTLLSLILHQAHHRGQMSVLMRQAGVPVTGPYGPAKEEWAAMGRTAPE